MRGQANGVEDRRPRGDDHEADDNDEEEEEDEEEEGRHRGQGPPQQRRDQVQRPSSGPQQNHQQHQPPPLTRNVGYVGKHRLSAAIARLDQELQSLQVTARSLLPSSPSSLSPLLDQQLPRPDRLPLHGWLLALAPPWSQPADTTHLLPELCAIQILPALHSNLHDSKHPIQCPNCALRIVYY